MIISSGCLPIRCLAPQDTTAGYQLHIYTAQAEIHGCENFTMSPLKPKVRSPSADFITPNNPALALVLLDQFAELIEAYEACQRSAERVKEPESALKEAKAWLAIIDRRLQKVAKRDKADTEWRRENGVCCRTHHGCSARTYKS